MTRSNRIGLGVALLALGVGMIGYAQVQEDDLARGRRERHSASIAAWESRRAAYEKPGALLHEYVQRRKLPPDPGSTPGPPLDYYNLLLILGGLCSVAGAGLTAAALASKRS